MTPNIADLERIISSLKYDGIDTDSLTVGELRRALPAAATPSPSSADIGDVTERVIRENPYTKYTFAAQNNAVESIRAARYATMVARRVFKELATDAPAQTDKVRLATIEECARIADSQAQEFLSPKYAANQPLGSFCERFACDEVAKTIRALASQPSPATTVETADQFMADYKRDTLSGMIAAVYGQLDAEDCAVVDREWARQRGYILPTAGTSTLSRLSAGSASEPRFFIDHGMIHDRLTGKHVTTEPDSAFCDGIVKCCELLNSLVERREPRVFPLLFDSNWLENKIKSDPDVECEAGPDLTRNEPQQPNMREALEDIWALTASFSQYTLEHFARKVRSKVDAALIGSELAPGCCSATSPCSHQKADPASICETCACREARQCLHIIPECVCDGDPTLIDNPAFQRNEPQQSTEVSATLRGAAQALVHEIQESGTHTRWKRLANAIATEDERTQPQRDTTKWPYTLRFDDRDKYIDELEAQIARLRAVPQAAREPDRDAVAAIVLKAMQAKVDPDTYGASYEIKINADRAIIAADAILSLRRPEHNATNIT